jgi:hypothetical protein
MMFFAGVAFVVAVVVLKVREQLFDLFLFFPQKKIRTKN